MGDKMSDMTEQEIWDELVRFTGNKYGAAGLMGNLKAESNLNSKNLQNTYEKSLKTNDEKYTSAVDNGSYKNFVHDSAGYGLAQWTYHSRKQGLLDYAKRTNQSIGSTKMQLEYLEQELKNNYPSTYNALKNAKSVKEASDAVITQYERPANQSNGAKNSRTSMGNKYYEAYSNGNVTSSSLITTTNDQVSKTEDSKTNNELLTNSDVLKDKNIEIDPESIDEIISTWKSEVISSGLSYIDLNSVYSSIINAGVGKLTISKISNDIKSTSTILSSMIGNVEEVNNLQKETDDKYSKEEESNDISNSYYSSSKSRKKHKKNKNDKDVDDNKNNNLDLGDNKETILQSLSTENYIDFMTLLGSIDNDDLVVLLADTNSASELKEVLLKSNNLSKDLKKSILKMDDNVVQTTIKSLVTNKPTVDDITKEVLKNYTSNLDFSSKLKNINSNGNKTLLNEVSTLFDSTKSLSESDSIQKVSSKIYNDESNSSAKIFIKTTIDEIAKQNNISVEKLLKDNKYEKTLSKAFNNITKELGYIRVINNIDENAALTIVKETKEG